MSIFGLSGLRKSLVDKSAAVPQLAGDLAQRTPLSAQIATLCCSWLALLPELVR